MLKRSKKLCKEVKNIWKKCWRESNKNWRKVKWVKIAEGKLKKGKGK